MIVFLNFFQVSVYIISALSLPQNEIGSTRYCVDPPVPSNPLPDRDFGPQASQSPDNGNGMNVSLKAAFSVPQLWQAGQIVTVSFDTENQCQPNTIQKISDNLVIWNKYINLTLQVVENGVQDADILVQCDSQAGTWSQLGQNSKFARPSMNYAWLNDDDGLPQEEVRWIVLHEFGHAIGLQHEHQNPSFPGDIDCNSKEVADRAASKGRSVEQECFNLRQLNVSPDLQFSDFDPVSVMLYDLNSDLTGLKYDTQLSYDLSVRDIIFAKKAYPFYSIKPGTFQCTQGFYAVTINGVTSCTGNINQDDFKRLMFEYMGNIRAVYIAPSMVASGNIHQTILSTEAQNFDMSIVSDDQLYQQNGEGNLVTKSGKTLSTFEEFLTGNDQSGVIVGPDAPNPVQFVDGKIIYHYQGSQLCVYSKNFDGSVLAMSQIGMNNECITSFTLV